jgi:3-oxoadipate enol-lactonase
MTVLLEHDVAGAGRAVVLLHSGVCDRRMWEPQWRSLGERFRVVRCDLRGYGATPVPPESFSHAGDVVALLDHLGIERASLVGSSFGGRVALEVAVTRPQRVDRLVLLCGALQGLPRTDDLDRFAEEEDALFERGDVERATELNVRTWLGPDASEETRALVGDMQRHAFEVQLAAPDVESHDLEHLNLARIGAPTLVVSGARDLDYFRAVARHLTAELRRARHVELAWAAHLPSLERPAEVTRLVLEFLGT